jgi:hypothetical protein
MTAGDIKAGSKVEFDAERRMQCERNRLPEHLTECDRQEASLSASISALGSTVMTLQWGR